MTAFTFHASNFYGLRDLRFSPTSVSVLVGANGAGKTTMLLALKLVRAALERGLPEAVGLVLHGSHGLRHRDASEEESIEIGVQLDRLRWWVRLRPAGATVDALTEEALHDGEREVLRSDALGFFHCGDQRLRADGRLGLRAVLDSQIDDPAVTRMAGFLRNVTVFHDPDLYGLREGSNTAHSRHLHTRGLNAMTMLRSWHQRRNDRHRFEFVLTGLASAFPGLIEDLDFVEAGNTLAGRVYRPGREDPEPLRNEANGVLAMLVLLCDLAAAEQGGVVAIDEPELALHPFAIRSFARLAERWARKHELTVILCTHSPVLLDAFEGTPEHVFVLDRHTWPGPTRLTELKNPDWLRQFRLGELYADGELGSNDDE